MSPDQAAYIARKQRGFSVSANTVHCPKTPWIFRIRALPDCPIARKPRGFSVSAHIRFNKINSLQILANVKKAAWPARDPQRKKGSFTGTAPRLRPVAACQAKRLHPPRDVGSGTTSPPASTERDVVVWLLVAERPPWLRRQPLSVIIGVETANPRSKPASRPLDRKRRISPCAVP
jgi:hypothetical protein